MKRFLMLTVMGLMLSGIGLLVGCGDDDDATGPSDLVAGDTLDSTFVATAAMFEATGISSMDSIMSPFIMFGFPILDTVLRITPLAGGSSRGIPGLAAQEEMFVAYHVLTGYWYLYAAGSAEGDEYWIVEDSMQFLYGEVPVQFVKIDSLTEIRSGLSWTRIGTTDTTRVTQTLFLEGLNPAGDSTVINATQTLDHFVSTMGDTSLPLQCDAHISGSVTYTDVVSYGDGESSCPVSGNIAAELNLQADCVGDDTVSVDGGWRVTYTFNGSSVTAVYEDNTTRWTVTDSCVAAMRAATLLDRFRSPQH